MSLDSHAVFASAVAAAQQGVDKNSNDAVHLCVKVYAIFVPVNA